ncbi:PTS system, mannose-specific IIB component [Clostridium sp. USBA 49]|uniref:mannose/fructose/sorbose PTS transporter subunit IIB n=1 Tax=Clostridium sp. USBA 49 TaxID=1881060 RepID=UPI00099A7D1C|nr:mannose/fructose/sorbose PTS transporter subunit IIB [Clostridium sp. USBA 49]SKA79990.1 PTS system, mannose-specific IIB component [Clostridium sp. USBA 49]
MNIVLARIDDRLIHGQVATVWAKETRCERIIVCNDDVAKDEIRKTLLVQVAPPGVKASVVDVEKAIRVCKNPKYENDRALLLFTNPTDVLRMVEGGIDIKSVNIGGMAFKEGKKQITSAVSVDEKDIEAFKKLHEKGIELEIRKVITDAKVDLMSKIQ